MNSRQYQSWGRYPITKEHILKVRWRHDGLPTAPDDCHSVLPYGNGRSYGDVCLNDGGALIDTRALDHFMGFDPQSGILKCEAGVLLADILHLTVPKGWFLPVTPGTQYATVGGAIANDVHGKNHHRAGTFGCHLKHFELLRSDGERIICSPKENTGWFNATIGGLGLTGLITWCEIQMMPIESPFIQQEAIQYKTLDDFFELTEMSDSDWEYTVAWVDCLADGHQLGRGIFIRGNHAGTAIKAADKKILIGKNIPMELPFSPLNRWNLKVFNMLYYHNPLRKRGFHTTHYEPFFYPLDAVKNWNRIYGSKGFLQFQCVIPLSDARRAIEEILQIIAKSGRGSPLAVLKKFGSRASPGLLSFPREGITLALDFTNCGEDIFQLFRKITALVRESNGAIYPAKDSQMSAEHFCGFYPQWEQLIPYVDPRFSSGFWRRVLGDN